MGVFFTPPPQKRVVQPKFLDVPIKVLECVDIVFLGQFDVPEHVFNISLVIGSLLVAPMARQKHFRTQKMTKNDHIWELLCSNSRNMVP